MKKSKTENKSKSFHDKLIACAEKFAKAVEKELIKLAKKTEK